MKVPNRWMGALLALALIKVFAALLGMPQGIMTDGDPTTPPYLLMAALVLFLAGPAVPLVLGSRSDARALHLGVFFLIAATSFTRPFLAAAAAKLGTTAPLFLLLDRIQLDAFLPYVLWKFVRDFPRVPAQKWGRGPMTFTRLSGVLGVLLVSLNLVLPSVPASELVSLLGALDRTRPDSLYHPVLLVLIVSALVYCLRKAQRAPADESRRVRLLIFGVTLGMAPLACVLIGLAAIPGLYDWVVSPGRFWVLLLITLPPLFAMPVLGTYAVYSHRALDVKLVIRMAVQYALARYTVLGFMSAPLALLAFLLYSNREARLVDLVTGGVALPLSATAILALGAMWGRERLLLAIDRRFYRERYDARATLGRLLKMVPRVGSLAELDRSLRQEVDRAFHPHSVAFLVLDKTGGRFVSVDHSVRPLSSDDPLAAALDQRGEALFVDFERGDPLDDLDEVGRRWLLDSGAALLVPVRASERAMTAILCLGDRRGDLPFTREDASFLEDIAAVAGTKLQGLTSGAAAQPAREIATRPQDFDREQKPGKECPNCRIVHHADAVHCADCGKALSEASVPYLLANKFQMRKRIGEGGMGIVYRADDLSLGRSVAIKSLPRMDAHHAVRLRREARTMANVSHPNLAVLYGSESWNGYPMLIVEFLSAGTLADRLRRGPLTVAATIDLGISLCRAVEELHARGVLHRDIKPSNVGLTPQGLPKLLDFGVAHIYEGDHRDPTAWYRGKKEWLEQERLEADSVRTLTGGNIVGTALYMSPEALGEEPPDPRFDVWALSVLLYEAAAGRNPFWSKSLPASIARIQWGEPPDIRADLPDCPPAFRQLLLRCLNPKIADRPQSAKELRRELRPLKQATEEA